MNRPIKQVGMLSLSAVALAFSASAQVDAIDLFLDGNDTVNPTWTHHSGLAGSSGQTWTVAGGAYRLQAPNNSPVPGIQTYGYIGSLLGSTNSDVRVEADFLDWAEPTDGLGGVFGIGARWQTTGGLNNLKGYGYAYEPFASSGQGEMVLYKFNGVNISDVGSQQVNLNPNKSYHFLLDITGNTLIGQVYEIGGGIVAEKSYTDNSSPYLSGVSSVFGYSAGAIGLPATDFTVDNVVVLVPEPAAYAVGGLGLLAMILVRRNRMARI